SPACGGRRSRAARARTWSRPPRARRRDGRRARRCPGTRWPRRAARAGRTRRRRRASWWARREPGGSGPRRRGLARRRARRALRTCPHRARSPWARYCKMPGMAEGWELLTLRGLAATDERAEMFTGTLVIHRLGSPEPVESVGVQVKRNVLVEMHETLGRLLARSTGLKQR